MTTMTVLDSTGATQNIEKPLAPGRAAAAASRPVVLATEDSATIGALTETAPASDTASSGLNGRLQRIAQRLTSLLAVFPTTIDTNSGNKSASTLRVVIATDQPSLTSSQPITIASGPTATARLPSAAASTNATNVKTTAGRVFQISGKNNAAYDIFLVLYDAATNPPVPGATTIRKKIICPAGQAFVYDAPDGGMIFSTGIGYAFTKLVADADTTVLVAADITAFNLDYA